MPQPLTSRPTVTVTWEVDRDRELYIEPRGNWHTLPAGRWLHVCSDALLDGGLEIAVGPGVITLAFLSGTYVEVSDNAGDTYPI